MVATALRRAVRRPRIVIPLAVVIALAAGASVWAATRSSASSTGLTTSTSLVAATTGTIAETLSASGTVANATTSTLTFGTTGTVTAVKVAVGSKVTKGEVLATVDSTSLANTVAQQQSTVASQQATVDSDSSGSASSAQLTADQATLTADQSQLTEDEADLADAQLVSPIAGTVTVEGYTVGDQVGGSSSTGAAGTTSSSGTTAGGGTGGTGTTGTTGSTATADNIEVVSTGTFVANVTVDDTEVGELAVGDEVTLTQTASSSSGTTGGFGGFGGFAGFGGGAGGTGGGTTGTTGSSGSSGSSTVNATPFFGTVASVGLTPTSSTSVASYPVVVDVTGTPAKLLAGANVSATVTYKSLVDVLEVPTAAIHTTGTSSYVLVSKNGKLTQTTVTTGAASGGETQILTGISAGEMVQETTISRAGAGRTRAGFGGAGGFPGVGGA